MMEGDNKAAMQAIEKAVRNQARFFAYCLPDDDNLCFGVQINSSPKEEYFIIHPFIELSATPSCIIYDQLGANDYLLYEDTPSREVIDKIKEDSTLQSSYMKQAEASIVALREGKLSKIVLSRVICENDVWDPQKQINRFATMIEKYPHAYRFFFFTQESGWWMGASPERYLSCHENIISTMALAGSRPAGTMGGWGDKEIEEQAFVAQYIADKLNERNIDFQISALYTRGAGGVEHLCNDFVGKIKTKGDIEFLCRNLHPTPALAGIPKDEAVKFIEAIEGHNRKYYGGYVGYVSSGDRYDLYVNLRSVEFDSSKYCIYIGGGLTKNSIAIDEWNETMLKSNTMLEILK